MLKNAEAAKELGLFYKNYCYALNVFIDIDSEWVNEKTGELARDLWSKFL
jgi:hypothetical protein